jgi:hypothetical protein
MGAGILSTSENYNSWSWGDSHSSIYEVKNKEPDVSGLLGGILSVSDMSARGGDPVPGEQEGKAAPLERGRGRMGAQKKVTAGV